MKKSLLVVVVLLAAASLMAAMAYTSTTVNNPSTMKIVNTSEALIALEPGDGIGANDLTARVEDNVMKILPGKGMNDEWYGLQPASSYDWNPLFKVTNNSADNIEFNLKFQNGSSHKPSNSKWTFTAGNNNQDGGVGNQPQNKTEVLVYDEDSSGYVAQDKKMLEPGDYCWVRLQINVKGDAVPGDDDLNTTVHLVAKAVQ